MIIASLSQNPGRIAAQSQWFVVCLIKLDQSNITVSNLDFSLQFKESDTIFIFITFFKIFVMLRWKGSIMFVLLHGMFVWSFLAH